MPEPIDAEPTQEEALVELARARQDEAGFQRYLLDDDTELTKLQMALTGKQWDEKERAFVTRPHRRAKINDEGAETLVWTILYPMVKNAKLSRFNQIEINDLMYLNMVSIANHIHYSLDAYKLALEDVEIILSIVETFLKSVFNRALNGAEQNRLADSTGSQESFSRAPSRVEPPDDFYPYASAPTKKKRFLGF